MTNIGASCCLLLVATDPSAGILVKVSLYRTMEQIFGFLTIEVELTRPVSLTRMKRRAADNSSINVDPRTCFQQSCRLSTSEALGHAFESSSGKVAWKTRQQQGGDGCILRRSSGNRAESQIVPDTVSCPLRGRRFLLPNRQEANASSSMSTYKQPGGTPPRVWHETAPGLGLPWGRGL